MGTLRKIALVVLLGLSAVIAITWGATQFCTVGYDNGSTYFQVSHQGVQAGWGIIRTGSPPVPSPGWRIEVHGFRNGINSKSHYYEPALPFPHMMLVTLLFIAPLWFFRPRPFNPLRCEKCKYNLIANTTGVCPECGTATAKANAPSTSLTPPGDA